MEYKVYEQTIKPHKGNRGGKRMRTLSAFLDSGDKRWDIYKYDEGDTAGKVYIALQQASKREPFRGKIQVVKIRNVVSLNRMG